MQGKALCNGIIRKQDWSTASMLDGNQMRKGFCETILGITNNVRNFLTVEFFLALSWNVQGYEKQQGKKYVRAK